MGEIKIEERALIVQQGNVVTVTQGGKTQSYRLESGELRELPAQVVEALEDIP